MWLYHPIIFRAAGSLKSLAYVELTLTELLSLSEF